ncbi:MAG: low specificity L-threonine aldolase, partial [Candidatus Latescibacteria bacterium]|nr:low specificity L-threonine aldolase [Candidatus Latescibacterota bacterium]
QAGIIAAAGSFALDHHVDRMAEDHANAKRLANGIAGAPRIQIDVEGVETNMVRFDVADLGVSSSEFGDLMLSEFGIRVSAPGPTLVRLIPHLGITDTDVDTAAEAIQNLAKKLAS